MNTAPASRDGYLVLRAELPKKRAPGDAESMKEIAARAEYAAGDPDTVEEFNRIHFRASLCDPENLERVIDGLRPTFTPKAILKARAIEDRLRDQTWLSPDYDLLPSLHALPIRTLIIHGDHEFIPLRVRRPNRQRPARRPPGCAGRLWSLLLSRAAGRGSRGSVRLPRRRLRSEQLDVTQGEPPRRRIGHDGVRLDHVSPHQVGPCPGTGTNPARAPARPPSRTAWSAPLARSTRRSSRPIVARRGQLLAHRGLQRRAPAADAEDDDPAAHVAGARPMAR